MKQRSKAAVFLAALAVAGAGCGGGSDNLVPVPTTEGELPLAQVQKGMIGVVLANENEFEVRAHPVAILDAYKEGQDSLIAAELTGDAALGFGFSGTPLNIDGKTVGAVAYGDAGENKKFLARGIEDMLSLLNIPDGPPAAAPPRTRAESSRRRLLPYFASGLSPSLLAHLQKRTGVQLQPVTPGRAAPETASQPVPAPGRSVAVIPLSGDVVNLYAVGALTYARGSRYVAFGHPFDGRGARMIPVAMATVSMVTNGTFGAAKTARMAGPAVGTLKQDRFAGVVIDFAGPPPTTPLVTVMPNGKEYRHQLFKDGGSFDERFYMAVGLAAPLDTYRGINRGSLKGTLSIELSQGPPLTLPLSAGDQDDLTVALMMAIYDTLGQQVPPGASPASARLAISELSDSAPPAGTGPTIIITR